MPMHKEKTQRSKRHHIVPKFYLSGFASEKNQVETLDLRTGSVYRANISDACLENDYFSLPVDEQIAADAYENHLSEHEGHAASALKKVFSGEWPIPADDRLAIATWLAYQHVRVKRRRVSFSETHSQMIKLVVGLSNPEQVRSWIESNEGKPLSDEALAWEISDLTKLAGPEINLPAIHHIQLMERLLPVVAKRIWFSSWILIRFERKTLITGDTPVVLLPGDDRPEWSGLGLLNAKSWLVPLGRRTGLEINYSMEYGDIEILGTTAFANIFNEAAKASARQYIYCNPEDGHLLGGISREMEQFETTPVGDDLIEVVRSRDFAPDSFTSMPKDIHGQGFTLTDVEWPIVGRINKRPENL